MDGRTDGQTDAGQSDPYVPLASQVTQKLRGGEEGIIASMIYMHNEGLRVIFT